MTKLWGGRFTKNAEQWVEAFGASIPFDQKLIHEDLEGSMAHVKMLKKCGILSSEEADKIKESLQKIKKRAEEGKLAFRIEDEDVHMNVEKLLYEEIGPLAGKLHTARSRNDQVATDMHLYLKRETVHIMEAIIHFQKVLLEKAKVHVETILPGYTHLQRAQPVSLAHHLLAYFWMLSRDWQRFSESFQRVDVSPLGAGALAGTTFPIDREYSARLLGFSDIYENSLDAVSDRDFIIEFINHSALVMMHLSRFAEELILWQSEEFRFVEIDDAFATGSSMMPQKKNPDMAELIRGKTGRVYGHLLALFTVMKGLPLAYNKDLQEDKEGMFDTVETVKGSLAVFSGMVETLQVNEERMSKAVENDFSIATEVADYLAEKGVPFRRAHEVVGGLVLHCLKKGKKLTDLTLEEWQSFDQAFADDVYNVLVPRHAVERRTSRGGTGFAAVRQQIEKAEETLKKQHASFPSFEKD